MEHQVAKSLLQGLVIVPGIHDICGSLNDTIGFNRVIKTCRISVSVMKDVVIARLAKSCSECSTAKLLERDLGISHASEKIYRMLDTLTKKKFNHLQDIYWQHLESSYGHNTTFSFTCKDFCNYFLLFLKLF